MNKCTITNLLLDQLPCTGILDSLAQEIQLYKVASLAPSAWAVSGIGLLFDGITACPTTSRKKTSPIALDDFGSGLSSLTYLKTLDVDYLKIDGSFVKGIVEDDIDRLLVRSTIEIANHLGLKSPQELYSPLDVEYKKTA